MASALRIFSRSKEAKSTVHGIRILLTLLDGGTVGRVMSVSFMLQLKGLAEGGRGERAGAIY